MLSGVSRQGFSEGFTLWREMAVADVGNGRSMTARGAELGCYTDVEDETVLALPTGVVTVEGALLAIHGILVAWASSDLAVLPAVPGSDDDDGSL